MSKINSLILAPGKSARIVMKVMSEMHGISKPNVDMITIPELVEAKRSVLDFSTEELGYFTYNGKVIDIIFPR